MNQLLANLDKLEQEIFIMLLAATLATYYIDNSRRHKRSIFCDRASCWFHWKWTYCNIKAGQLASSIGDIIATLTDATSNDFNQKRAKFSSASLNQLPGQSFLLLSVVWSIRNCCHCWIPFRICHQEVNYERHFRWYLQNLQVPTMSPCHKYLEIYPN